VYVVCVWGTGTFLVTQQIRYVKLPELSVEGPHDSVTLCSVTATTVRLVGAVGGVRSRRKPWAERRDELHKMTSNVHTAVRHEDRAVIVRSSP
jgi:hypothetical protein